jgi:hypothetical protein
VTTPRGMPQFKYGTLSVPLLSSRSRPRTGSPPRAIALLATATGSPLAAPTSGAQLTTDAIANEQIADGTKRLQRVFNIAAPFAWMLRGYTHFGLPNLGSARDRSWDSCPGPELAMRQHQNSVGSVSLPMPALLITTLGTSFGWFSTAA